MTADATAAANAEPPADLATVAGDAVGATHHQVSLSGTGDQSHWRPDAATDPPPGFVVERELGVGGMGVVYLARQVGLNRPVALKMVKGGMKVDPKALIRFLAEAEAVASIKHPNVVEVYQYGDHRGTPYMALEFCPGGDLTSLSRGDQSRDAGWFRQVAGLMARVADGVNAAHEQGIVHRDLKPHNVFLAADGTPKVADFGLAKQGLGTDLTQTDAVMGTPAYMAPEQAGGRTKFVGPEADVWALGVMLFELCAGERPISTSGPVFDALAKVIAADVPPLKSKAPAVPPDLALIAHKCLSANPRDRYPTADGLANDLRNWLDGKPISARPAGVVEQAVRWAKRHKAFTAAAAVCVMAAGTVLGSGVWFSNQVGKADGDAAAARADERRARELAATEGYFRLLADLRDRPGTLRAGWVGRGTDGVKRVADGGLPPGARADELRTEAAALLCGVDAGDPRPLSSGQAGAVAFHPEGRWVAVGQFKAQGFAVCSVFLIDPASGDTVRTLRFTPNIPFQVKKGVQDGPRSLAVSPDGRWLVAGTRSGQLHVWDLTADAPSVTRDAHDNEVLRVAFAPDGKTFYSAGGDHVRRWEPTGKAAVAVWKVGRVVREMAVLADGRVAAACAFEAVDTAIVRADLTPEPDTNGWRQGGGPFVPLPGRELWAVASDRQVTLTDPRRPDAPPLRQFLAPDRATAHDARVIRMAASPCGRYLATTADDQRLRVWDAAAARLLLDLPVPLPGSHALAWHPHARTLVVTAADKVLAFDLSVGDVLDTIPLSATARGVAWSPDGQRLAASGGEWNAEVVVFGTAAAGHTPPRPLATNREMAGNPSLFPHPGLAFAPDGRRVTYRGWERIAHLDPATGVIQNIPPVNNPVAFAYAPDGRLWSTAGTDVRSWDAAGKPGPVWSNALAHRLSGKGTVRGVAAGRTWVLAGVVDGSAILLRAADAGVEHTWTGSGSVEAVALSPDETLAVLGSEPGEVRVARVPGGGEVARLPTAHRGKVAAVAFVSDRLFVTGSADGTVRLWSVGGEVATAVLTLRTGGGVLGLAVSPDGTRLAATVDGEVGARVWDLARLRTGLQSLRVEPGY